MSTMLIKSVCASVALILVTAASPTLCHADEQLTQDCLLGLQAALASTDSYTDIVCEAPDESWDVYLTHSGGRDAFSSGDALGLMVYRDPNLSVTVGNSVEPVLTQLSPNIWRVNFLHAGERVDATPITADHIWARSVYFPSDMEGFSPQTDFRLFSCFPVGDGMRCRTSYNPEVCLGGTVSSRNGPIERESDIPRLTVSVTGETDVIKLFEPFPTINDAVDEMLQMMTRMSCE